MLRSAPNRSRRAFLGLAGGAVTGLTFAVPTRSAQEDSPSARKSGGTLTMLVEPEPTTLVTVTNSADPSMLVSAKVTEGLLAYGFDLDPRPQLATRWSVSSDGLELTFKLREGVRWHDGTAFTSGDVAYSIGLLKEFHPRGRTTFANVIAVRTPDSNTAIIELSRPAPFLLHALAACESPIVPRHVYAGSDAATNRNGAAPIGTGPFRFKEWVRGSHVVYERNPDYWDAPKPYLDRLVVRFIEDPAARLAAIETGAVALAPAMPVPLGALAGLRSNPDIVFDTNGYQYTNQVVRLEFNLDDALMRKIEVRRAIAHAIDRRALIDQAWLGYAVPAFGPISPALTAFAAPDLAAPSFDPAEAERLLDTTGLQRGPDGIRFRLPLDYVPTGEGYRRTADTISAALATIGIATPVRSQDFPAYIKRIYSDRDFHFTVGRMNNMYDPSVGVQRVFWSRNFQRGVPFSNGSHYASADADSLLERAAVETDPARRRDYFLQFQKIVVADLPDVTLLAPRQITIANKHVINHTLTADGAMGNLAATYLSS